MKERLQEILQLLLKRLDLTTLGVLVVLLVLCGYLIMAERNHILPPPDQPSRRQFTLKLPDPQDPERDAQNLEQWEEFQDNFLRGEIEIERTERGIRLVRNNMFEIKSAEEREADREALNASVREAEQIFRQDRLEDALAIVEEVLRQDRTHRGAADLRRQIRSRMESGGT